VQVSGVQGRTAGASCCGRDRLRARDHGSGHRGRRRCRLGDTARVAVAPFTSGRGPYRAPPIPRSGAGRSPAPTAAARDRAGAGGTRAPPLARCNRRGRRRHPPRWQRCQPGQRPARHTSMAQTGMRRRPQWWLGYTCWALVLAAAAAAGFWLVVVYAAHQAG
jgi:hypothetical protein